MKRTPPTTKTSDPASKRILIVDDHPLLRLGLVEWLAREPGLSICGAFGSAEEALAAVMKLQPDLVVTDLSLPGKSGVELIKDLVSMCPGLPVIALSLHDEELYAERCLRAGGRGYVMKSEGPEKLALAIRQVLAGRTHVSPKTAAHILDLFTGRKTAGTPTPISELTDREFEVFQWIGRGLSTRDVAKRMHISGKTIETHRAHIKSKLSLGNATELVAYAARWVTANC